MCILFFCFFGVLFHLTSSWQIAQLLHIINKKKIQRNEADTNCLKQIHALKKSLFFNYKLNNIRNL